MDLADQLINDEGLKFTVTLNVSPDIYAKLFATVAASVIVAMLASTLIKTMLFKK